MKPASNRFNPEKLLLSKWTARQPQNREKHFLVCELLRNEEGELLQVELQAVLSRRNEMIDWRELRDSERWQIGWK